jgi:[protein-PII] uridylyltransferase
VIRRHARIGFEQRTDSVGIRLARGPSDELTEVVVMTKDRPGLLADVAAVLAAHRLGIVGAEIYTRNRAAGMEAFDVFLVSRAWKGGAVETALEQKLTEDLSARLSGELSPEELLSRLRAAPAWSVKRSPDVPTEVLIDNETSSRFTVVDVFTRDRVGLLHVIARTLFEQGLSIALSKVNTEGQRVADVFYVRDAAGKKLDDPERAGTLQRALSARIEEFHASAQGAP